MKPARSMDAACSGAVNLRFFFFLFFFCPCVGSSGSTSAGDFFFFRFFFCFPCVGSSGSTSAGGPSPEGLELYA